MDAPYRLNYVRCLSTQFRNNRLTSTAFSRFCHGANVGLFRWQAQGVRRRRGGFVASFLMKQFNGSERLCDEDGHIVQLKDALGKSWRFGYHGKWLTSFTDPGGTIWNLRQGKWESPNVQPGSPTPKAISVNHTTGEIRIEDNVRVSVYFTDGSTQVEVIQQMDGTPVRVRFTEYATRPNRAFVVSEKRGSKDLVTWLQDANAKLFKLEYDRTKLIRYTDLSSKPPVIWIAEYDATGNIHTWEGREKESGNPVGFMNPVLLSVEENGNRHYKSGNGANIVVDPSGTAFAEKATPPPAAPAPNAVSGATAFFSQLFSRF